MEVFDFGKGTEEIQDNFLLKKVVKIRKDSPKIMIGQNFTEPWKNGHLTETRTRLGFCISPHRGQEGDNSFISYPEHVNFGITGDETHSNKRTIVEDVYLLIFLRWNI